MTNSVTATYDYNFNSLHSNHAIAANGQKLLKLIQSLYSVAASHGGQKLEYM
jgi:hypothetical protein